MRIDTAAQGMHGLLKFFARTGMFFTYLAFLALPLGMLAAYLFPKAWIEPLLCFEGLAALLILLWKLRHLRLEEYPLRAYLASPVNSAFGAHPGIVAACCLLPTAGGLYIAFLKAAPPNPSPGTMTVNEQTLFGLVFAAVWLGLLGCSLVSWITGDWKTLQERIKEEPEEEKTPNNKEQGNRLPPP